MMQRSSTRQVIFIALAVCSCVGATANAVELTLDLATRDPKTDKRTVTPTTIDSAKIAIVVIDMWNYHPNMTAAERVAAMVPRMNRTLAVARKLGMTVLWCPTDVASQYVGTPQRERAMAVPRVKLARHKDRAMSFRVATASGIAKPDPEVGSRTGNYGWDGMHPDLVIADNDYIASGTTETASILKHHGVTHVIYMGVHANQCLIKKPSGIFAIYPLGFECIVARDLNDNAGGNDRSTKLGNASMERNGVPTLNMTEEMRKTGQWNDEWFVDKVSITPWGRKSRACHFTKDITVTLSSPWQEDVEVRYTLDGSDPGPKSKLYTKPLVLDETAELRTATFRNGRRVSLFSDGYFAKVGPMPPKPDIYLDSLKPVDRPYSHYKHLKWYWHPGINKSFEGKPMRVRGEVYEKGLGMRAPGNLRYDLSPEYDRFVALVGVDENLLLEPDPFDIRPGRTLNGRFIGMHGSVRFHVYIDGELAGQSTIMRVGHAPWRFDIKIPPGAKRINLSTTDAGSRSPYDLGNWVDAGFVKKGPVAARRDAR